MTKDGENRLSLVICREEATLKRVRGVERLSGTNFLARLTIAQRRERSRPHTWDLRREDKSL